MKSILPSRKGRVRVFIEPAKNCWLVYERRDLRSLTAPTREWAIRKALQIKDRRSKTKQYIPVSPDEIEVWELPYREHLWDTPDLKKAKLIIPKRGY